MEKNPLEAWAKTITDAQASNDPFMKELEQIEFHMREAFVKSAGFMQFVLDVEGDSDLHRKLQMYLVPNLNHWIYGMQAGNMKDLRETLQRRATSQGTTMETPGLQGDGHEVLTKRTP